MNLPIMAAPEDLIQVVKYLSKKPIGCTLEDAKAALSSKLLDPRKINAYIVWGIVFRDDDRLKLTALGKELASAQEDEEIKHIFKEIIKGVEAYNGAVEWMAYKEKLNAVTNIEIAQYWYETKKYGMENESETTLKDRAVCFFKICEAAGLGKFFLGRRGMPTRLEVEVDLIEALVNGTSNSQSEEKAASEITFNEPVKTESQWAYKEKENEVFVQTYTCKNGSVAKIIIPEDIDEQDLQLAYDIFKMVMKSRFNVTDV